MIKFGFKLHNLLSLDDNRNTYFFSGTEFYHLLCFFAKKQYKLIQLKRGFLRCSHGNFRKKFQGCNQNHEISHLKYHRKVTSAAVAKSLQSTRMVTDYADDDV